MRCLLLAPVRSPVRCGTLQLHLRSGRREWVVGLETCGAAAADDSSRELRKRTPTEEFDGVNNLIVNILIVSLRSY
jgi:hypothetical protein